MIEFEKVNDDVTENYFAKCRARTYERLQAYADDNQFDDTKFVRRNEDGMKYFFVENGTIFKLDENEYRFYELDLDEFVWDLKPSLVDLYYDVSLRYSEIEDFNDYYLNKSEEFDIDSGRQL